jgi:hypothetical protein
LLGAGEVEGVAQHLQQRGLWRHLSGALLAIDCQCDIH